MQALSGFEALARQGSMPSSLREKFSGNLAKFSIAGEECYLLIPTNLYEILSGKAVQAVLSVLYNPLKKSLLFTMSSIFHPGQLN